MLITFIVVLQISFVIPLDVVPGRIGLLITIFLVLINIFNQVTEKSPNTETLTNISIWIISCIIFVYSALVEYGCLLCFKHVYKNSQYFDIGLKRVDTICLSTSMILFFLFNVAFWFFKK